MAPIKKQEPYTTQNPDPSIERSVGMEISPQPHPYNDFNQFMDHTQKAAPPKLEPGSGQESLYLKGVNDLKRRAGLGLADINGDGRSDPNTLFNAIHDPTAPYDPQYDAAKRDIMTQTLRNNPEAAARYAVQRENQNLATERGYTQDVQDIRGTLSPEGQQQFDAARDSEIIGKVFPQTQPDPLQNYRDYEKTNPMYGNPATGGAPSQPATPSAPAVPGLQETYPDLYAQIQGSIRRDSGPGAGAGQQYEAGLKQQTLDLIERRRAAGLITDQQAEAAMRALASGHTVSGVTTNTAEGKLIASALGLPIENGDKQRYRIDESLGVVQQDVAKFEQEQLKQQQAQEDRAIKMEDRASQAARQQAQEQRSQEYLNLSIEDRARKARQDQQEAELKAQGFETQVLTLPDGSKQIGFRGDGTQGWQFRNYKSKEEPGIKPFSDGWYETLPNGEVKYYSSKDGKMGSDGKFHRWADVIEARDGQDYIVGKKIEWPNGVVEYGMEKVIKQAFPDATPEDLSEIQKRLDAGWTIEQLKQADQGK